MDSMEKEALSIDKILKIVGEFGRYQWLLESLFCVMIIPGAFVILIMYFAALTPTWECVTNSTICLLNGTFTNENKYRCDIPRTEWKFSQPKDYSIVTQFDIYCDNEWLVHVTTSIFFIGWAFGVAWRGMATGLEELPARAAGHAVGAQPSKCRRKDQQSIESVGVTE